MSFGELAELVRTGKVTEGTRVARVGSTDWQPAWRVPGLLRAAGITEPGDSPAIDDSGFRVQGSDQQTALAPGVAQVGRQATLTPALSRRERGILVVRGAIAAAVGLLGVGFFYRWAHQTSLAFPMPPQEVDGEWIDCYFPLVGRCTSFECGLLYFDVFAVAAVATWHALRRSTGGN